MTRISVCFQGILVIYLSWAEMTQAEYMLYKDPNQSVENRTEDLLSRMTLAEKIGQMCQIERRVASAEDVIAQHFIGSVLSGGGSVPATNASAETWINMVNGFQRAAMSTRLGIPIIYGIDAVHGNSNVYNATIFPHNIGLGVTRDPELIRRIGAATALEVRATGIHWTFAPCIAVCRNPRWGRCYESYSEDHTIVQHMTSIISGLQGEIPDNWTTGFPYQGNITKITANAKHYLGDGGTFMGIDEGNTVINWEGLLSIHMPGYLDAIARGVSTVMISYSSWNGVKMHTNRGLITGYLKGQLGFKGLVISDWEALDRITNPWGINYTYSVLAGINAGIDMVMIPYNFTVFINDLTFLVNNGFVNMTRIDDAVRRILRVKLIAGLFEHPYADYSFVNELGSQAHRDLAREAVRKSLVLLKNGKPYEPAMLPLPKVATKILVAGTHADNLGYQCGGWTITWQGTSGNNATIGTTILDGIKATVDPTTEVVYNEVPDPNFVKSAEFSYALVVVGEPPYAEYEGDDLNNLTILEPGPSIIKKVCQSVRCVVILVTGRPVVFEPYLSMVDALVAAWLPGTEGQGVADALFGDFGFNGTLSRTWFKTVDQLPMNIGDPNYDPLFPFGFGLTTQPVNDTVKEAIASSAKAVFGFQAS